MFPVSRCTCSTSTRQARCSKCVPKLCKAICANTYLHLRDPVVVRATAAAGLRLEIPTDKRRRTALTALAPVLIPRDHPLWCTERFSFVPAPVPATQRAADWDACLWQVQLETFGAASTGGPLLHGWRWDTAPHPERLQSVPPSASVMVSNPNIPLCFARVLRRKVSLLFGAGWMSGIAPRHACSQSGGSKS
ncbi:hypothetical protein B0F90DRAFT_1402213 [Multifurca ochricompacta]|uniref:Uncharacterized protein n=1 Tax=Multifurca ochricompacta TaxID=376703 RepID=A0AAD4QK15_9AGAM|nr:hypothetical protein B0F90DRAFT_1402213 [Multifurca ochricompacta]